MKRTMLPSLVTKRYIRKKDSLLACDAEKKLGVHQKLKKSLQYSKFVSDGSDLGNVQNITEMANADPCLSPLVADQLIFVIIPLVARPRILKIGQSAIQFIR